MAGPRPDDRPRLDHGTKLGAAILTVWSLAILFLGLAVHVAYDDLAAPVALLSLGASAEALAVPAWALLLSSAWLVGLAVIALATRSGNHALRREVAAFAALREAEKRYQSFMQHLPGVAFIKDAGGHYVFVSDSWESYFGVKVAETVGRTDLDLFPKADAEKFRRDDARVRSSGEADKIFEETSFGPQPTSWLTIKFVLPGADDTPLLGGLAFDVTAQRRAEHELLQSQRQMSTLLRNLPGMAYRCRDDDPRTMEFCSSGATELTGYAPDELIGNHRASYGHLVHPEDRERVARVLQNSVRNGVPYRFSYRITTRHGVERHVFEQGRCTSADGVLPRLLEGFVSDVTERKRAEAEVERRSAEFRMLFDQAPMGIWLEDFSICRRRVLALRESGVDDVRAWFLANPDEASRLAATVRVLDVNAVTLRDYLGGKKPDTLIEPGASLHPGGLKIFVEMLAATADDRVPCHFEGRADRYGRDVLVAFAVVPGHEDDYARVLVSLQDVTALKRGEAELRAAEQRYRALFEQAPGAILVFDPATGRAVAANPAAEALLGAPAADIARVTYSDLFVDPDAGTDPDPDAVDRLQQVLRTDGQQFEVRLRSLKGPPRDVLMNLRRVEYAGGSMLQAACLDITLQKDALRRLAASNRQLEATNADLRQLAHFVSHDFSEPLRMVAGFVQLLTDRVGSALDERGREYVAFALEGAERMDRMIDAILRYSQVGTRELTPVPVDPGEALKSALGNLGGVLTASGGEVTFDELPPVLADEGLLILLFQNLVSNALKYRGDAPPRVHVSARRTADRVVLAVRDNGVGIAPEHHEQIFQLFGRSERRDDVPGSGIGLATCRRVTERLGGSIRVESAAGRGATFLVELPAATPRS